MLIICALIFDVYMTYKNPNKPGHLMSGRNPPFALFKIVLGKNECVMHMLLVVYSQSRPQVPFNFSLSGEHV